jgi:flagellar assembly protein FliH
MADEFQAFVPRVVDSGEASQSAAVAEAASASAEHQPWQLPEMSVHKAAPVPQAAPRQQRVEPVDADPVISPDVAEEQRQLAYDQGFQQGLDDAKQESARLLAEQSQQLQLALAALREPLKWVDGELERELFQMTLAIAKQLLRHELTVQPELIENLIHKAVSALPISDSGFDIFVNPADAEVIRDLHEDRNEPLDPAWHLVDDPSVSRGGCRISSDHSRIDDQLETRIQHVVAEMLGEPMVPSQLNANDRDEPEV